MDKARKKNTPSIGRGALLVVIGRVRTFAMMAIDNTKRTRLDLTKANVDKGSDLKLITT